MIGAAVRYRRMFGGAMRQCGIIAAGGLYALKNNIGRIADDHRNARVIAERLAQSQNLAVNLDEVRTNIIVFRLAGGLTAEKFVDECREKGVLLLAFSERVVRLATHLDVGADDCRRAADIMLKVAASSSR
jgi:threonine aldolase